MNLHWYCSDYYYYYLDWLMGIYDVNVNVSFFLKILWMMMMMMIMWQNHLYSDVLFEHDQMLKMMIMMKEQLKVLRKKKRMINVA
jgi:hypothetical protein